MNAKEYLMQIEICQNTIDEMEELKEEIRENMEHLRSIQTDREKINISKNNDKLLNQIVKMAEIEEEVDKSRLEYIQQKHRITKEIITLGDAKLSRLLSLRYIKKLSLAEIADEMGYDESYTRHLHQKALLLFTNEILNKKE